MKKYFSEISRIYGRLLNESPDNITIGDKYYSYDRTPNTYTGFIDRSGGYVISRDIIGHSNLRYEIQSLEIDDKEGISDLFFKIKTNTKNFSKLRQIVTNNEKIRIWVDQKVFSMWNDYKPNYKESIINAISATGSDYTEFKYDNSYLNYENMPTYDEFLISDLSPEEKERVKDKEEKQRQAERDFANIMAGNSAKRSIDIDVPYKTKTPTWMSRQGD